MTVEEQELYEKIKQEPNNFMFHLLFSYDANSNVIPIQGKTLKLMEDGVPMIVEVNPNPVDTFAGIRTNKSFREISNGVALEMPSGKNSIFYKVEREILTGKIPKL